MATPFLQIAERGLGWQLPVVYVISMLLLIGVTAGFVAWIRAGAPWWWAIPGGIAWAALVFLGPWLWAARRQRARENLIKAAKLWPLRHGRLLIVRGYVDEASLSLALGAAGAELINFVLSVPALPVRVVVAVVRHAWNFIVQDWPLRWRPSLRVVGGCIMLVVWLGLFAIGVGGIMAVLTYFPDVRGIWTAERPALLVWVMIPASMIGLLGIGGLALTVHGRELFSHCLKLMITSDSAPDVRGQTVIATLKFTRDSGAGLRHALYQDDHCAQLIVGWIHDGGVHLPGGIYDPEP